MTRMREPSASVPAMIEQALKDSGPAVVPEVLTTALSAAPGGLDVWGSLARQLDLSELRPKLADDIELRVFRLRWGNDYAMIANPRQLIHFQLEVWEAELVGKMDEAAPWVRSSWNISRARATSTRTP